MIEFEAGLVMRAAEALRSDQETFSRAQVAFLMALAERSGYESGWNDGAEHANSGLAEALQQSLGGPDAQNMKHAIRLHHRVLDQRQARDDWKRAAYEDRPHGLLVDDPRWPAVAIPGKPNSPATTPAQVIGETTTRQANAGGQHLKRAA